MTSKILKGDGQKAGAGLSVIQEGGVVHKRIVDARDKAAAIIRSAEKDAEKIRKDARKIVENAQTEAKAAVKKGYADGESKGMAKVTEKLVELERLREKFYEGVEPEVIGLSMDIAEKVIGKMACENPELIKSVVRQALDRTLGDRIFVRLSPADYEKVMLDDGAFKDLVDKTRRLVFREDASIADGGCIVESGVGTIDAQLDLQLAAIRKALEIE